MQTQFRRTLIPTCGWAICPLAPIVAVLPPRDTDINAATPVVTGIDWKKLTDYLVQAADSFQIRLRPTGMKTPVISSNVIGFQSEQVSTLFVFDNPSSGRLPFGILLADGGVFE